MNPFCMVHKSQISKYIKSTMQFYQEYKSTNYRLRKPARKLNKNAK